MPKFAYKATNREGKNTFGVLEAENQALAIQDIRTLGLYPTQVREARKSDERRALRKGKGGINEMYIGGIKWKQIVVTTRQLATLIDAGLPLLRSLNILISQLKPSKMRDVLREVAHDVQTGSTFSEGLAKHPKVFDRLYVNMVRAGEVGGMLEVVLNRLAIFMEKAMVLKRRVKSAAVYPLFVVLASSGIVSFLLARVVPVFAEIFADMGATLPGPTQLLIDIADFMKMKWWILLLMINSTLIAIKLLMKIPPIRNTVDFLSLKIPLLGDLITKVAVARFARTLGTLLNSGVPILQALKITKEVIANHTIQKAVQKVHDSIKEGETIAAPLDESKVFPAMVVNMIDVGEETGSLDTMLNKVADIYDGEVEAAVEAMLSLMEPVIILVLGGIIGFIVVALYLPIFSLGDAISS